MQLQVAVRTEVNKILVHNIAGMPATWEGNYMPTLDELKKAAKKAKGPSLYDVIDPQGESEVSLGLEEKVSGPEGTYSSVTVHVRLTFRCAQNEEQVQRALSLAHRECVAALERYIEPAQQLLVSHLGGRSG